MLLEDAKPFGENNNHFFEKIYALVSHTIGTV